MDGRAGQKNSVQFYLIIGVYVFNLVLGCYYKSKYTWNPIPIWLVVTP